MNTTNGNGELILIVDENDSIRDLSACVLEMFGYTALKAGNGQEAIAVYEAHVDTIKAVLVDMRMSSMGGVEIIRALQTIDPGVRIIASSGAWISPMQDEANRLGVHTFLNKPYDIAQLLNAVAVALTLPSH